MAEYLISLSLLITVVLLIRAIFRKSISPRVMYALWLVVVFRMCLPVSLFEVDVKLRWGYMGIYPDHGIEN